MNCVVFRVRNFAQQKVVRVDALHLFEELEHRLKVFLVVAVDCDTRVQARGNVVGVYVR